MTSRAEKAPLSIVSNVFTYGRIHAAKLQYLAYRAVGRKALTLRDIAVESVVVSPEETLPYVPPRMPQGALDRILRGSLGEPPEPLIETLTRREWHHVATEMHTLRDVALVGYRLYANGFRHDLNRGDRARLGQVESFDEVTLVSTWTGAKWFGHFIHDELPLHWLAEGHGLKIAHAREPYRDEAAYRDVFSVPTPQRSSGFFARRFNIFVDYSQNASKRARYEKLRAAVPRASGKPVRVYLQRSGGNARVMHEEAMLMERLDQQGFVILQNGRNTVTEIVEYCSRATQIVTVDGSHAAPTILIAPAGAELCVICPPDRVTHILNDIAQSASLRTALYIGNRADAAGYSVNVEELLGFINAG